MKLVKRVAKTALVMFFGMMLLLAILFGFAFVNAAQAIHDCGGTTNQTCIEAHLQ